MKKELSIIFDSIAAGFMIGIGGIVFLSAETKIIASLLFCVGMFAICTLKMLLFTGKTCYLLENKSNYLLYLGKVWIGNLLGAWLAAKLVNLTRIGPAIITKAQNLVTIKNADSLFSLFLLGAFCGILIYLTVENFARNPHEVGKYLAIFFGVTVFLMCGFEHSIADMFYYSLAKAWNLDALLRIAVISFGNMVGGCFLPLLKSLQS